MKYIGSLTSVIMRIIAHAFSAYKWVILNSESFNKVYGKNKKTFTETIFFCAFLKFCRLLRISKRCLFVAHFRNIIVKTKKEIALFEHIAYNKNSERQAADQIGKAAANEKQRKYI